MSCLVLHTKQKIFQIIAPYATVVKLIVISEEDAATPKVKKWNSSFGTSNCEKRNTLKPILSPDEYENDVEATH